MYTSVLALCSVRERSLANESGVLILVDKRKNKLSQKKRPRIFSLVGSAERLQIEKSTH